MSDLAPSHLTESKRTPGRDIIAAKSAGNVLVVGSLNLLREVELMRSQPTRNLALSSSTDATDGTGTRRFLRRKPTAFSTDPFSFPEWGLQNLDSKR